MAKALDTDKLAALKSAVKLLVDAGKDIAAQPSGGILAFSNVIPDLVSLVPQIGDLLPEIKALVLEDYVALVGEVVADLGLSSPHAQGVVDAAIILLDHAVSLVPDVEGLLAAIKAP